MYVSVWGFQPTVWEPVNKSSLHDTVVHVIGRDATLNSEFRDDRKVM